MTAYLRFVAAAIAIACLPTTALATGGLDCGIHDSNLDFDFEALYNYAGISPLFQVGGTFASKNPKTFKTLKTFSIEGSDLIQQWFEGRELKLQFYRETTGDNVPHAWIKLTIEAIAGEDEIGYEGTYRLAIEPAGADGDTIRLEGKVGCSAG